MPRFSENDKKQIKERLFTEGERLFTVYGLKKVTIDEIVSSVNIAKASFYTFYENKENLYFDIVQNIQLKIFTDLDQLLKTNYKLSNKGRVRQVFSTMYQLTAEYPILSGIDKNTAELLHRKVDADRILLFYKQNMDAVHVLLSHGITFECSPEIASEAFQALYHSFLSLQKKEEKIRITVTDILLNALIEQIVCD